MSGSENSALKVLIIDDIASLRDHLTVTLKAIGFEKIDEAENGVEALKKCRSHKDEAYELIMCDINMPQMGGIEFVKSIRDVKEYKLAPIIMVSTESEVDIILEAISHGANDYVLKPAEPDVLKQKIEKALKR